MLSPIPLVHPRENSTGFSHDPHNENSFNAFSLPPGKLGYRFLPWNLEEENIVGTPAGIEPTSPAIQADMLTTTPQRPGTNSVEFALSHSTMDY